MPWYLYVFRYMADVAQLVRALVCGTGGRGFETHHSPHNKTRGCATVFVMSEKSKGLERYPAKLTAHAKIQSR